MVFDRHFYQPDWSMREPVDRIVSMFYYLRSGSRWRWRKDKPPSSWFRKDFESCVREGDLECRVGGGGQDMQVTYFCGSHLQCANSSNPLVLQAAKYNLERRYSVVGVLEHFNISLRVLEAYLPGQFNLIF